MMTSTSPSLTLSSAAFSMEAAHTSPMELSALGDHLAKCSHAPGRLFSWQCAAEAAHQALASRFVTTLAVATVVLAISSMIS